MKVARVMLAAVVCLLMVSGVAWAEAGKKAAKPGAEGKKAKGPLTVEEMWAQVDSNKDGTVELSEVLALKPLKGDEARAKKLLEAWDANKDGKVTKDEFKEFVAKQEEARKKMASKLDANGDGVLSVDELKGLKNLGGDEAKVKAMLERLDDNKDGKVTVEEFARFRNLLQAPAPTKAARKQK
ncbi:MAG: EF-hand domain-containing protein [Thermogutta sp.]|jgi:Ca2+-binding EF-hand superfamily protein